MKVQVFDPPMCCSTGICGPGVDPALAEFSADLDWLKRQGIDVERYNLSQQTDAFVSNTVVCEALKTDGNDCLPLIMIDGKIVSRHVYPNREQLAELAGIKVPKSAFKITIETEESAASGCCSAPSEKVACCKEIEEKHSEKKSSCC